MWLWAGRHQPGRGRTGEGTLFQSPSTKTLSSSKWLAAAPLPMGEGKAYVNYVNGKLFVEGKLLSSEAKVRMRSAFQEIFLEKLAEGGPGC